MVSLNLSVGSVDAKANAISRYVGAGATLTIYSDSPGVPGYIDKILLVQGGSLINPATGNHCCNSDLISCYIDGESSPSIHFDAGSLLANYNSTSTIRCWVEHVWMGAKGGGQRFVEFHYPIPYQRSIRIDYTASALAGINSLFSAVDNFRGAQILSGPSGVPVALRSYNVPFSSSVAITATQMNTNQAKGGPPPFLNIGGAGWVVYHGLTAWGEGNSTPFLESPLCFYLNGNTFNGVNRANYEQGGTEDTFQDAWYFVQVPFSSPQSAVSYFANGQVVMAVDYLKLNEGIPFTNGCYYTWQPKPRGTTPSGGLQSASWTVLYYVPLA